MDFDFQAVFAGLMALLLLGALGARKRVGSTAQRLRTPAASNDFTLIDYRNVTWLKGRTRAGLTFSLGDASSSILGANTVVVAGVDLSTNKQEIIERFEGSELLQELVRLLFSADQGVVRALMARPQELVITLHQPRCGHPLQLHQLPELQDFLRLGVPRLERELQSIDVRVPLNRRHRP